MNSQFDSGIEGNRTHPFRSNIDRIPTTHNEKNWEWTYLVRKCRNLELEESYDLYMRRLRIGYLSIFIFIELLVASVHTLLLLTSSDLTYSYIDMVAYMVTGLLLWLILSINFKSELISKHGWIVYASSWLAVSVMVLMDIGLNIYHATSTNDILNPIYDAYTLYAIYMFMPIPYILQPLILGIAVTICYIINYSFVIASKERNQDSYYETNQQNQMHSIVNEALYLISVNCLGIFFRLMRDIALRTTFLDRRQYVEENLLLRYARDQERSLLLSILPAQIADRLQEDVRNRIERSKQQHQQRTRFDQRSINSSQSIKRWRQPDHGTLFIEPHKDVTVLYADVVNYTHLTTTLDVKKLVEALHDLFVRFDIASEEHNVMRIKFLGDCYYCVAGLASPNEDHAMCCVDLGLRMIKDIRDVREKRHLNIDMRIGVHSGDVLSGVIGAAKWQFDIWSKDVDIANRLEATGATGRVHVSQHTLSKLDGEYFFEDGTEKAREDPVLQKHNIRTFLIKSLRDPKHDPRRVKRELLAKKLSEASKSNFMYNSTLQQYNQVRNQAKLEMCRELDKMPIGRIQMTKLCRRSTNPTQDEIEEETFRRNISSFCLLFQIRNWEYQYIKEPDMMFKYSIALSWIVYMSLLTIQLLSKDAKYHYWIIDGITISLLSTLLIISWYKKLWIMYVSDNEQSRPRFKPSRFLYRLSDCMQRNIVLRISVYFLIITSYIAVAAMQVMDCTPEDAVQCFHPWVLTNCMTLIIGTTFLFTRIPFVVKTTAAVIITLTYAILVMVEFHYIFKDSPSTNANLNAEYSHILLILITLGIFHLMERQTEFIAKVDYNWKRQLLQKQDDALITNDTIKVLLVNILPSHVAEFYLSTQLQNELYYEEYDNVAVMFASIKNFDTDKIGLRVLNEIICDFDDVLNKYSSSLRVEKIKVANWTYMAACGLDVTRSEKVNAPQIKFRNLSLMPNGRRSEYRPNGSEQVQRVPFGNGSTIALDLERGQYEGNIISNTPRMSREDITGDNDEAIKVMANFALDLMRAMRRFNAENMQSEYEGSTDYGMLRIGISHGRAMAGVVGISKPHYDIWGNPVNMASRMDSTGIPGKIQVTENTALKLRNYNIQCNYRGMTFVKGRGNIPTYILGTDDNYEGFLPHQAPTTSQPT
ncbi:adenylyl cyclase X E isoform X1 [Drosophila albomicans]|uniref:adenylate cyclase n=1 Tax=Drosophila albomicans TaxID=7291 RepID=A0A6P8WV21_DROAB|nr:adenylyl cyclase X E isoform X1 [Drosophila albomicans]XP_034107551.1 adenylyl cyclase X E isoform X1 [Drosophila albomicans]XP_034107552.1 adenylyl cyclase X E isoform X1 [Drosophila albomicans]XP_034107554.1 adenylyl cyclase X E isoform X1 [Drosophila albomicans]XP_051860530.1 adenylyl cyclase X E isoform X1 [Drosophila albomicans]